MILAREIPYLYREWQPPAPEPPPNDTGIGVRMYGGVGYWQRWDRYHEARQAWERARDRISRVNPTWPDSARINPVWPADGRKA